jgi:hypothetical protein
MPATLNFNSFTHDLRFLQTDNVNRCLDKALQQDHTSIPTRQYIGASQLGKPCARSIQYDYTQTPRDEPYPARILRIFEIGHTLEQTTRQWLQKAGFEIETHDVYGEAYGFSVAEGQIQGHVDGIIRQVPEELKPLEIAVPALWECKTMNAKSWKETVEKGVKASKPVYAVQIALYQAYMEESIPGLSQNPALFTALNKDTAELYHEWVDFDGGLAQEASDKAVNIIRATRIKEILPRSADDPDTFICRYCDWKNTCWKKGV